MVRIALISDIHFGKLSRTSEFAVPGEPIQDDNTGGESLKESMISILNKENIQYLCVAGDLTSMGSPQEFSYCKDMILDLAHRLSLPKDRIIIGLGNHDIDWKISNLHEDYDSSNPNFPKDLVKEQYQKIAASASLINLESIPGPQVKGPAPYSGIIENDNFIMFILNTGWCCTKGQAISHGKLDSEQLSWFEKEAANYADTNKWKVILMHHHPFNYSYPVSALDISTLEEGSRFLEIAGKNGFHLVMHGHRHHPRAETNCSSTWKNPITFVCAGSFAVNASHRSGGSIPNTLHIVELTDEVGVVNLTTFQYSPAQGWIPLVKNCPETPLDYMMKLGRIFSPSDVDHAIQNLCVGEELLWSQLEECLQFMPFDELNKRIQQQLNDTYRIVGQFPNNVVLLMK